MKKKISQLSEGEKSALKLELRQNRLTLNKRNSVLREKEKELINQLSEVTGELEKNARRLRDIEVSLDNLEDL